MKKTGFLFGAVVLMCLISIPFAFGQNGMGGAGWGPGSAYNRLYDPTTVETDKGKVVSVEKIKPMKGMSYGIHVVLDSDKGKITVHLGPSWYLDKVGVKVEAGDEIVVSGSRVVFNGKPVVIAAEIRKAGKTWKLRDDQGVPLWAGKRAR